MIFNLKLDSLPSAPPGSGAQGATTPKEQRLSAHSPCSSSPCLPPLLPWFGLLRVGQGTQDRAQASFCSPCSLHFLLSSLVTFVRAVSQSQLFRGVSGGSSEHLCTAPLFTSSLVPAPLLHCLLPQPSPAGGLLTQFKPSGLHQGSLSLGDSEYLSCQKVSEQLTPTNPCPLALP